MNKYISSNIAIDNITIQYNQNGKLCCVSNGGDGTASSVLYSNSSSGLQATNAQQAIDELSSYIDNIGAILDVVNGEVIE